MYVKGNLEVEKITSPTDNGSFTLSEKFELYNYWNIFIEKSREDGKQEKVNDGDQKSTENQELESLVIENGKRFVELNETEGNFFFLKTWIKQLIFKFNSNYILCNMWEEKINLDILAGHSDDESAEESEFIPSYWDQSLQVIFFLKILLKNKIKFFVQFQPSKSSLKSPERENSADVSTKNYLFNLVGNFLLYRGR